MSRLSINTQSMFFPQENGPRLSFSNASETPERTETSTLPPGDELALAAQGSSLTNMDLSPPAPNKTVKISKGDTLGKIAKEHLGDFNRYMEIYELNKDKLNNPNDLRIGMEIELPIPQTIEHTQTSAFPIGESVPEETRALSESVPAENATDNETTYIAHSVGKNESLSSIAKHYLGDANRYREIFDANRDQLKNPNDLHFDPQNPQVLRIPVPNTDASEVQHNESSGTAHEVVQEAREHTEATAAGTIESNETVSEPQAEAQAEAPQFAEHTVGRNETLSTIALKYLGDANRYMEIYQANTDKLSSPDAVGRNQVLRIPLNGAVVNGETLGPNQVSGVTEADLNPDAKGLLNALKRYQAHHNALGNTNRAQTTPAELIEIAYQMDQASKALDVDPKLMLAVYAHESGGFNPRARSHTGAGGLGQLTGIAIRQVHFLAGMAKGQRGVAPYTQHSDNFIQRSNRINQRYDIRTNIWTSTAYMRWELGRTRNVETAIKRYGDPHVSSYSNKVNAEYKTLWGAKLF